MENAKQSWYSKLSDSFDALMRKFDMPEDMEIELRDFVFTVAKEQFRVGNKSGISWVYRKMREEQGVPATPVAA
ncbi:hypothetical protein EBT31_09745 [bacterium]|nr:hypothetical protein [bacterium]